VTDTFRASSKGRSFFPYRQLKRAQLPASTGFIAASGTIAKKLWHNRRSFPRHPPDRLHQLADASTERMPPELTLMAQESGSVRSSNPGADNP
jgi:hypothetical protein